MSPQQALQAIVSYDINSDLFYDSRNQKIFEIMQDIMKIGHEPDLTLIQDRIGSDQILEDHFHCCLENELASCLIPGFENHISILRDRAEKRILEEKLYDLQTNLPETGFTVTEAYGSMDQALVEFHARQKQ